MNPIAQTFTMVEPQNGVDGVFLTGVDLYFQKVSTKLGVTVQIRDTVNGVPSVSTVPYASKTLQAASAYASSDASVPTNFTFDTPIVLESNHQYAIIVIPVGGSPDYILWTAQLGGTDVSNSQQHIYDNNQNGTLFISTNDLNYTAVPLESMKYSIYTANFSSSQSNAVYTNGNTDYFYVNGIFGGFTPGEIVYTSNSILSLASLNVSGVAGTFNTGDVVIQTSSGSSPNTAVGVVYSVSGSVIKVSNVLGTFANTSVAGVTNGTIKDITSSATATITTAYQNVATFGNTSIVVPDINHPDFANGNYIFVGANNKSSVQVLQIVANSSSTNTLFLNSKILFANQSSAASPNSAFIGRVRGDANLYGFMSSSSRTAPYATIILDNVTSNLSMNFTNTSGKYLIGGTTGAVAKINTLFNPRYDSITAQFGQIIPHQTNSVISFKGVNNTATFDSSNSPLTADSPYEFIDNQRIIMSRSNEVANTTINGNKSLQVTVSMNSSNTLISPYVDKIRTVATVTHNRINPASWLSGYTLNIANTSGSFNYNDVVTQSNSTQTTSAVVISANSSTLNLINVGSSNASSIATFIANGTSTITVAASGAIANVNGVQIQNESLGGGFAASRYISKNVILAAGQDAEDVVCYLGAYRPTGTNIQVYAKVLHTQDSATFDSKDWSFLPETSSPALISSLVNQDDLVELVYSLPSSIQVYSTSITSSNTSATITFPTGNTNSAFAPGSYMYMADQSYYVVNAAIASGGTNYAPGDTITFNGGTGGYNSTNATFTVTSVSSNVVTGLSIISGGVYAANSVVTAGATSNNTGVGSGLTLTLSGANYLQSTKFNVRQVVASPDPLTLVLSSNTSILSNTVAVGTIPNLQSQSGAFKYSNNNSIARYVTASDVVYDSYISFAIKIVLSSNSSTVVPRVDDMRTLALQV